LGQIIVIGAGLAGSEAAWQIAQQGERVILYEMRPGRETPAHHSADFAELVCSNSLGSDLPDRAPGLLKAELRRLKSVILSCADQCAVPAGGALAVDREAFARCVTERVTAHPRIEVRREEIAPVPRDQPVLVASGPLTSDALADDIAALTGSAHLHFFDAMAPIVAADSVDQTKVFRANRWGRGGEDYINCPMTHEEYDRFVDALLAAETIPLRDFERSDGRFFEACLPVEVLASRGRQTLAFGPLRPVGLFDPRTGNRPWAVVQLRQDNLAGTLYNLVGFQTNLRWPEQQRVFGLIPGLEHAEFVRFGQMHRNTFVNSPALLEPTLQLRGHEGLYFAGQLVGTEGYIGSTASGLVAGVNVARSAQGRPPLVYPPETMLGALCRYVSSPLVTEFQPMKPNFGLLPPLDAGVDGVKTARKRDIHALMAERALSALDTYQAALDG
jgi:methylenetetrahydrofolate--tRNA-(uracil-5-)-methyltransferase